MLRLMMSTLVCKSSSHPRRFCQRTAGCIEKPVDGEAGAHPLYGHQLIWTEPRWCLV